MRDATKEDLLMQARDHGLPRAEVLGAWEEMVRVHGLPWYVEPELETRPDGTIQLSPAVDINLLSRVEREVPGWGRISGPTWPAGMEKSTNPMWLAPEVRRDLERRYGTAATRWGEELAPMGDVATAQWASRRFWQRIQNALRED